REGERGAAAPHSRGQVSWIWRGSASGFAPENRIAIPTHSACSVDALENKVLFCQCAAGGRFTNDALLYEFGPDGALSPDLRRFEGEDARRARLFRSPEGGLRVALVNHHARRSDGYDRVYVYTGGADGYRADRRIEVPGWCAVDTVTADLDDDGFPEMIVCNDSENAFHLDPGHHVHHFGPHGFEPEKTTFLHTDIGWGAAVADFDRDGFLDILTVTDHWNALSLFRGGPEGFTRSRDVEIFPMDESRVRHNVAGSSLKRPDAGGLRWIAVADLNGDGWLDVALPAIRPRSYVLWGGPEGFDFARRQEFATGPSASARVADLDGDGRPELVFGSHTMQASGDGNKPARQPHHSYLHVYWNGEDGFAESRKCILRADAVTAFCMGDFDGDGALDIFCGSYQGETDRDINSFIYWNRGGSFSNTNRLDLVTHAASGCLAADFDGDGRVDLAVANHKIFGDHVGYSEVWWNGPEGFLPTRTTKLPTRGPHGMSAIEPGDILSRGPEERWTSPPHRVAEAATVEGIDIDADTPPKTWVKAEVRAAATEEALAAATWRDPAEVAVPAGGFLQLRLTLGAENSLCTPRVTRATVRFR
ncbi:MAG: VCBS repeat-containing protein, partial [Kiritimatiellae bacterium]|nr:VCBS repeat-containing protein [Kiritimatiellia bacterium]